MSPCPDSRVSPVDLALSITTSADVCGIRPDAVPGLPYPRVHSRQTTAAGELHVEADESRDGRAAEAWESRLRNASLPPAPSGWSRRAEGIGVCVQDACSRNYAKYQLAAAARSETPKANYSTSSRELFFLSNKDKDEPMAHERKRKRKPKPKSKREKTPEKPPRHCYRPSFLHALMQHSFSICHKVSRSSSLVFFLLTMMQTKYLSSPRRGGRLGSGGAR